MLLGSSKRSIAWIIILVLLVLALTVILYIVFRRYKAVESKLNYEMTDVRNVAR